MVRQALFSPMPLPTLKTLLKHILESYELKDIFNVAKPGLFWKLMLNRTLAFKNVKCSGGKKNKECLTFLLDESCHY